MTKKERLVQISNLKKQIEIVSKKQYNAFENFWPNNDYENVKKLCDYLIELTGISDSIQNKMVRIVTQCDNDYEKSAPYICDMLLREWNKTMMTANRHFGDLLNELTEKQKGLYGDQLDELIAIDMKINKLMLSEYVNDE